MLLLGIVLALGGGSFTEAAGAVWYSFHPDSLNLSQAVTQRYILPVLWDPIAITVLTWPLWLAVLVVVLATGVVGLALVLLFRPRRRLFTS